MFATGHPPVPAGHPALHLVRAHGQTFTGPAEAMRDPVHRAAVGEYLTDMARPYRRRVRTDLFATPASPGLGHSYGEMAEALIHRVVSPDETVDLLVLAFSIHDMLPGRATATYLSHACPGTPMSFAICDQGSAAAYTGLRVAQAYLSSTRCRRVLLVVVEQAVLPYDHPPEEPTRIPLQHQGIALLFTVDAGFGARVGQLRQHTAVTAEAVAAVASAGLADLTGGREDAHTLLSGSLAQAWPAHPRHQVVVAPSDQPSTGVWAGLAETLSGKPPGDPPGLVVAADWEPNLGYLSLIAFIAG